MSKYFSNGESQIDRGHKANAIFSKRNGNANGFSRRRRYSGDENDENTGFGVNKGQVDSDEEDDDFERGGDPLSLEELDGWIKQINMKQSVEAQSTNNPPEPEYTEEVKEDVEYKPFASKLDNNGEEEEDDELELDFIAQVQKEKTEKRASILAEQPKEEKETKVLESDSLLTE